jgi:hypothetical protein
MHSSPVFRTLCGITLLTFVVPPAGAGGQSAAGKSLVIASVADATSGAPLENAEVTLPGAKISARTDWSGEARIPNVVAGKYRFQIRHPGYAVLEVDLLVQGDSTGPVFRLVSTAPPAPALEPVTVTGKSRPSSLSEFEARRAQGIGRFLTADELAAQGNRSLINVIVHAFSGLMAAPDPARTGHDMLMTRRANARLDQNNLPANEHYQSESHCGVDIYLNGGQFHDDLESIRTTDLAGAEYYPIGSAPGEYRRLTDSCGVLLLWTRK